jgi:hypothetical protein
MRHIRIWAAILLLLASAAAGYAQTQAGEKLFGEAKVLIFDKKWEAARVKLDELLESYPESPLLAQASFYKARCLAEQKGREREALAAFKTFLKMSEKGSGLEEEAEISVIDLSSALGKDGDRSAFKEVEARLQHSNKNVRYYAAFSLSYAQDKNVSGKGIPILKSIIETEGSGELKDRARIALLRISPDALRETEPRRPGGEPRLLRIQVIENGKKTVDINIPWALASLAINAMPESEKAKMRDKGYDLNKVISELTKSKSSILEINDEGSSVRIWIE